jgi:hypothetical protein
MAGCRITVLKKNLYSDLAEKYCRGNAGFCPCFKEEQVFNTGMEKTGRLLRNYLREKRAQRGEIDSAIKEQYSHCGFHELMELLHSEKSSIRTAAAFHLGRLKCEEAVPALCNLLNEEKSLYTRIAVSAALSSIGAPAVKPLIGLLGRIRNNQEKELPLSLCRKKSFPLARDLAARTLVKIGSSAVPALIGVLISNDGPALPEAIDALGGIAARTGDYRALDYLISLLKGRRAIFSWPGKQPEHYRHSGNKKLWTAAGRYS